MMTPYQSETKENLKRHRQRASTAIRYTEKSMDQGMDDDNVLQTLSLPFSFLEVVTIYLNVCYITASFFIHNLND